MFYLLWCDIILKTKFSQRLNIEQGVKTRFFFVFGNCLKRRVYFDSEEIYNVKNKGLLGKIMHIHLLCYFSHWLRVRTYNPQRTRSIPGSGETLLLVFSGNRV